MRIANFALALLGIAGCSTHAPAQSLPTGFVHLADIDPTIRQDMRYFGPTNFMGRKVNGYQAPRCILTRPAAEGLKRAQDILRSEGLTLVVFDCYRPARAVADFMAWTQTPGPADPVWRPNVPKDRLVPDGYIAPRSGHSRGSTIDLAMAHIQPKPIDRAQRVSPCARQDNNTLDFGTPFDCFDPTSATASPAISANARANRDKLVSIMTQAGFRNYSAEWWHFTLVAETNKTEVFDFLVR